MKRLLSATLCIVLLFIFNAGAQQATANLRGFVLKSYGEAASKLKVKIKLKSGGRKFAKETLTSLSGEYNFNDIPPGTYEISAADTDGRTFLNKEFFVSLDQPARLDFELEYGGDCVDSKTQTIPLNYAAKSRIINEILRDVLLKDEIAEIKTLKSQKDGVVLETDELQPEQIKSPKNIKLQLLSKAEIRSKADQDNSAFLYLSFDEFKSKGDCFVVSVSNLWAVPYNSKNPPTSGGGGVYVYRRKGGKLKLKTKNNWRF